MKPYTARDVAEAIGVSLDTLYRTREVRHTRDKLPRPICDRGRMMWERAGFDAWLQRFHPHHPPAPANDIAPPVSPRSDDQKLKSLHDYYRQMAGLSG